MKKGLSLLAVYAVALVAIFFAYTGNVSASPAAQWCYNPESKVCVSGGGGPCASGTAYPTEDACKNSIPKEWCYLDDVKQCVKGSGGPCSSGKLYITENECKTSNNIASGGGATNNSSTPNDGSQFIPKKPPGYNGPLPDCAFDGSCRNVNDLLELMVKWGQRIFGMIGSIALVMFVFGGFKMITSAGNSDQVKEGREILVAAVVGLVIAFSAYLLIDFVLDALHVNEDFRGISQ